MDVKSAFLYGKIEEEVYAPRAWYETLSTYLLDNGFQRGKIDKTLFIKRHKGDILLVQVYVDDIIFGSTKKELCNAFEKLMHEKFQMSSIGELTFFLGITCKKQTVVANSTTEAEYVAASSCVGQGKKQRQKCLNCDGYANLVRMELELMLFWSTVKAKTINGEVQLHARVDGKKIIITESTVRRDLQLEDAEGVDCLPNSTIFEQLTLMGLKITAWNEFSSTMTSVIICLATN
ncbi:putative ribonuclease H-like domain-containing protein [Tanacetum coccineum]